MSPPAVLNMEDTKPDVSAANNSNSETRDLDPVRARFTDLCKVAFLLRSNLPIWSFLL